jgi:hypothetical protein
MYTFTVNTVFTFGLAIPATLAYDFVGGSEEGAR